jgi:hypothetical protein
MIVFIAATLALSAGVSAEPKTATTVTNPQLPCTYKWFCDVPQAVGPSKRCTRKDGTWAEFLPPVGNPSCNCIAVGETVVHRGMRVKVRVCAKNMTPRTPNTIKAN